MPDFELTTNPVKRAESLIDIQHTLDDLPIDKPWTVTVEPQDTTRRTLQNKLLFRWHRSWSDHNGEPVGWAHGVLKLDYLLPMKLASASVKTQKRAMFEASILAHVPLREHKIGAAYDLIRSHNIPVKLFAEWLDGYQRMAAEQGCILTSNADLLNAALMRDADRLAA